MNVKHALGIDIGGTNVVFGLVNELGEISAESNLKTRDFENPELLFKAIKSWVDSILEAKLPSGNGIILKAVGIGAPNANYFAGTIEFAPNLLWRGRIPLKEYSEQAFHLETVVTNDANAAAIGEMKYGNAKDLTDFIEITLGTGLGSGIIISGNLVYGSDGMAGELGHISVDKNGRPCGCGRLGCLETYASSTGVVKSIFELDHPAKAYSPLLLLDSPTAKDVFDEAEKGDLFANLIVDFTAETLGFALGNFIGFSSPKAYVLFGGIAQSGESFRRKTAEFMNKYSLKNYVDKVEIRISALHDHNAAVLGAAALAFHEFDK